MAYKNDMEKESHRQRLTLAGATGRLKSFDGAFGRAWRRFAFFMTVALCALVFPLKAFPADVHPERRLAETARNMADAAEGPNDSGEADAAGEAVKDAKAVLQAAKAGDFDAQYLLARMYLKGSGLPKDPAKAARWFKKAADQGLPEAMEALGHLYRKGEGVPKDAAKAAKYYRQAAQYGRKWSQYWLGRLYFDGGDLPADPAKACFWASVALRAKLPDKEKKTIAKLRDAAAAKLSPARRKEVFGKAEHFRTKSWKREKGLGDVTGTGFIISRSGYILTNRHVVDGCLSLGVKYKNRYHPVTIKSISEKSDLAMLSFGRDLPQAFTIRSDPVRAGEELVIMGYPLGRAVKNDPLLTTGLVARASGLDAGSQDIVFQAKGVTFGSSGSAVLDASGMVVGVVWGGGKTKSGESNVRAVNMDELKDFLDSRHMPYPTRASSGQRNVKALGNDIRDMVLPIYCAKTTDR